MIYTNQRSKLSKKALAQREALLKEQRAIKRELKTMASRPSLGFINPVHIRSTDIHHPSRGVDTGFAQLKESPKYTGTEMIGIGQLHKSNAVPVFKQQEAKEIAQMRR